MAFREHELRRKIVQEMHERRFPEFALPADITQWIRLVPDADRPAEQAQMLAMPATLLEAPPQFQRHAHGRTADGGSILWERHSEASAIALIRPMDPNAFSWADGPARHAPAVVAWAEEMP